MKTLCMFVPAAAAVTLSACAPAVDLEAEEAAVRSITPSWLAMGNRGDAAGVAALFAEDGTFYRQYRSPFVGPEAVGAYLDWSYRIDPDSTGTASTDRVRIAASGDLAVEEGTWGTTANEDQGRYLTVYEKVGGAWKVAADVSVPTLPNGGAPDWAVEWIARWYEFYNAGDARAVAQLYAADAVIIGRSETWTGRAAIERLLESVMGDECSGEWRGFQVLGPVAAGWGLETCMVPGTDGAEPAEAVWRRLSVFERQADGSWLATREVGEPLGG